MRRATVQQIAEEFWEEVGEPEPFPRQLESSVLWALPLAVFEFPRLWTSDVHAWLTQRGIRSPLEASERPFHGCLIAFGGRGCVLLNGADSADEMRFTLAHEVAHFLLDYLGPRRRAVKQLGPGILEVFDGRRSPTLQEQAHATLGRVSVGFHTHLMGRSAHGVMGCEVAAEAECGADWLALELLAPEGEVRRRVNLVLRTADSRSLTELADQILQQGFGLPPGTSAQYARFLYPPQGNSSIREWLRQRDP